MTVTSASVAFGPCPLAQCDHMYMSHDWEEPGVAPMCCVESCGCGKGPTIAAEIGTGLPEETGVTP